MRFQLGKKRLGTTWESVVQYYVLTSSSDMVLKEETSSVACVGHAISILSGHL